MSILLQVVLGLLGLSFLVFIHELGHFIAARKVGVTVHTFSIGFGKKLLQYKRGETTYCISAIPFGGYVAMAGEQPSEQAANPAPGDFTYATVGQRAGIAFAGPLINILFAFVALWLLYLVGVPEVRQDLLTVGYVEEGSPGDIAGVLPGDTILSIDGKEPKGWQAFHEQAGMSIGHPMVLQLRRGSLDTTVIIVPVEFREMGIGYAGILPLQYVMVQSAPVAGSPAEAAGFQAGDTLRAIDGKLVAMALDVVRTVTGSNGEPMQFTVHRGEEELQLEVKPEWSAAEERWLIGIALQGIDPNPPLLVKRTPLQAAVKSWEKGIEFAKAPFVYISRIARGQVKVRAMSGPVGIVQVIGSSWQQDFTKAVLILALISMNLGIMNLLPLAVTDGGVLLFLLLEALRGKALNYKLMGAIQSTFFFLLISLFLYVTLQDLSRVKLFLP